MLLVPFLNDNMSINVHQVTVEGSFIMNDDVFQSSVTRLLWPAEHAIVYGLMDGKVRATLTQILQQETNGPFLR